MEIPAQEYRFFSFNFPKGARVEGKIQMLKGKDINMYLTSKKEFEKFREDKKFKAFLKYISTGNREFLFISPFGDKYYFIFENISLSEDKKLKVNIYIRAKIKR